jgi:alpha-beta hydrolase superfamily lysophospholipase
VAREFIVATEALPTLLPAIRLPVLLQWGTTDRICPPEGSEMVAERIGSHDLSVERWPSAFHEILNEPERKRVLDVLVAWLSAHAAV